MKLTHKNYFTAKNKHISNSDISNWKKCKNYFYKKKVTREIVQPITDPLVIGSAVDCWLTEGFEKFEAQYEVVARRKRDDTYMYQLTKTMYDDITAMCQAVEATDAYKQIKKEKHKSQVILQWDFELGKYFNGLCNIPDWFKIYEDGTCVITDLKTTAAFGGSKRKWHYKCLDYGYYRQQAMAQKLLQEKYPEITEFRSRHLIVEKDSDGIHNVYAWYLSQDAIYEAADDLTIAVLEIEQEELFNKKPATWDTEDVAVGDYE